MSWASIGMDAYQPVDIRRVMVDNILTNISSIITALELFNDHLGKLQAQVSHRDGRTYTYLSPEKKKGMIEVERIMKAQEEQFQRLIEGFEDEPALSDQICKMIRLLQTMKLKIS